MKKVLITVAILLPVFLIIAYLFKSPKEEKAKVETKPVATKVLASPISDPTSSWKKYENAEYHLSFRYPADMEAEELNELAANYLQVNLRKGRGAQAIIMIKGNYVAEDVTEFVGSEPVEEKTIAGQAWHFFDFPQGWSNSDSFTVFQKDGAGFLYSFKFNDPMADKLREQIMGTVKIAD